MTKKRITVTLDKLILDKVDSQVNGLEVRNRSHAIELLLDEVLHKEKLRKVVILGGGKGTRLRPFTYEIPKLLIPIQGKPIVNHIISNLAKHGVTDVILSLGNMSERVIATLGTGKDLGVNIEYIVEKKPLGTAGPLKLAKHMLEEPFVMLNGDILSKIDYRNMFAFHKDSKALGTVALVAVDDPRLKYGVVNLSGNKIVNFIEKPKTGKEKGNLVNAGIYILEPEVINHVPKGFAMLEKDVFPKLAKLGKLAGYTYTGPWYDIGTTENYEKAIKMWS